MTAFRLMHLLSLRILYLTTLAPKMQLSNISVKYSKEDSILMLLKVTKIGEYQIKIGRVHHGLGLFCHTPSLIQKESIVAYA